MHPVHTISSMRFVFATGPHRGCETVQDFYGGIPIYASICDANSLFEAGRALRRHLLITFVDVGFNHDADDTILTFLDLLTNHLSHLWLVLVILLGIA